MFKKTDRTIHHLLAGILILLYLLLVGIHLHRLLLGSKSVFFIVLDLLLLALEIAFSYFCQIPIHELGHLAGGLASGYHFLSLQLHSHMLVRQDGHLRHKRLYLTYSYGQCLMIPPAMKQGRFPVVLYNLGGAMFNFLFGVLFLALFFFTEQPMLIASLFFLLGVSGMVFSLFTGIPLHLPQTDTDGYHTLMMHRDPEAMRSFWVQLKVSEQTVAGVRFRDMPEDWFWIPSPEKMQNSVVAVMSIYMANRLLDMHAFEEVDFLLREDLLQSRCDIVQLHRGLIYCDLVYLELIGQNRPERLQELLSPQQLHFMARLSQIPTVLRTEYVYALLAEQDFEKAARCRRQFNIVGKTYPYRSDLLADRSLMEVADQIAYKRFDVLPLDFLFPA